jgi:hypothetical protein
MSHGLPPPLTLGAIRPGSSYCSVGDPPYWMGCLTISQVPREEHAERNDKDEAPIAPHCYFITSAAAPRLLCSACQPDPVVASPPAPAPEPDPVGEPWGTERPIWETLPNRRHAMVAREVWEERAAIMEYDGGLSRAAAEHAAYKLLVAQVGAA